MVSSADKWPMHMPWFNKKYFLLLNTRFEITDFALSLLFVGFDDNNDVITENSAFVREEPPQDDNGPPKIESEVEILHEKVTKQIIKEGHGQKPAKSSTCFCKCHDVVNKIISCAVSFFFKYDIPLAQTYRPSGVIG